MEIFRKGGGSVRKSADFVLFPSYFSCDVGIFLGGGGGVIFQIYPKGLYKHPNDRMNHRE